MAARRSRARERELADLLSRGTDEHYEDPVLYDFEYVSQHDDVDWYCDLVDARLRPGRGRILELGAGSGRVAIPIARGGHRLIALDRKQAMLDHLQRKLEALAASDEPVSGTIEPLLADMTQIPLDDASVDMVIAPFNCLMHLYTWQDLLACFREVARVLGPGGTFALDVLLPDLEWLLADPNERHAITRFEHPRTGRKMIYSTNHEYDDETQICHIRIYYDNAIGGRLRPRDKPEEVVHLAHRQIFPEELRMLISLAGLVLERHCGDFLDMGLNRDIETQAVVARKPERE
ncbi:class I SAM-dependent methyltransferase [Pseudenhygromyxa sp. WMMC2535]|uniref:class I SAM-dependent methyltransferase n=1 Tax=Pseudenhygromyxa sp. WMMC2535 TaxID=2712867 RepID=UPI001553031F|nr:class I SAM-dependent methyltransferase [Pseudenhygromyxa sp. WMMC2535]NVB36304.1 class I SAM-dependent methyltransferase [Pseudenhygromyxa sp. WMMC2535]